MATENIAKLKRKAVSLGMSVAKARTAKRADLEAYVSEHTEAPAPVKKKSAVAKKKTAKTPAKTEAAPKKRGRPPGSTNKPKATPAKAKQNGKVDDEAGRATISKLDYSVEHEGWNPRSGSPVERMWKSLKKHKDNVDKAYAELLPHVREIVGSKKRNGEKRTKAELEAMLRYRLNRTRFEFAVRTEQHGVATNRVTYGTGQYATTRKVKKGGRKPAGKK